MGAIVPQVAQATSDATGNATFTFPQPPMGTTWTGTVSIPQAPAAARGLVELTGTTVGNIQGSSPAGPYTARQTQLSLVVTGLTASTSYLAIWVVDTDAGDGQIPGPVSSVTTIVNEPGSTVDVSNTTNTPLYTIAPPSPPYQLVTSTLLPMTGVAQQLTNQTLAYGLILLADPANTGRIRISNHGDVAAGSAQLGPGQGIVIPIANASGVDVEGTVVNDLLSYWGA